MTVLLWVLVVAALAMSIVSTLLVIALARRLNEYQQRTGELDLLPAPGIPVRGVDVRTTDDELMPSTSFEADPWVVAYLSHGCVPCEQQLAQLLDTRPRLPAPVLVLASGDWPEAELRQAASRLGEKGAVARVSPQGPEEGIVGGELGGYPAIVHIEAGRVVTSSRRFADLIVAGTT